MLWKTLLDHEGGFYPRQLSSTSSVLPVSGTVSMVARKRINNKDRWQVRLYSLDIKTGTVVAMTPLFEQEGQDGIVSMSRRRDGNKERISVGSREYEVAATAPAAPSTEAAAEPKQNSVTSGRGTGIPAWQFGLPLGPQSRANTLASPQ